MKRILTLTLSLSICASPILAMQTASSVATASTAASSSSATVTRLTSGSPNWFARNPVLTALALAAIVVVGGGIKAWHYKTNSEITTPNSALAALPVLPTPHSFTSGIAGKPFQEKEHELELYKYFGVQASLPGNWVDDLNRKLAAFNYPSRFVKSDSNYLFEAYPALQQKVPYLAIANLPTPIAKLENLGSVGVAVYLKNDALTGGVTADGQKLYGGNKVRKLGYLLADAQRLGAKKVLTFGCVGSNHAVATAVHAGRAGMEPAICMLKHQPPSQVVQQNLLTHLKYGSELHYSPNNDIRKLTVLSTWLEHYKKDGHVPYVIPTGGSNMIGALGFVTAAFELAAQIKAGLMPMPTHIYVATGSCGTTAGLLLGCKAAGITAQIVAVAVEPDEDPSFAQNIQKLFTEMNQYLHELDATFPLFTYSEKDLRIDLNFTGPEYGIFTPEGVEAAQVFGQNAQVSLEGTYTAKAFAGLLHDIKAMPQTTVLFWNTYFGFDFSEQLKNLDYKKLPRVFHDYFDDKNLQPLAQKK